MDIRSRTVSSGHQAGWGEAGWEAGQSTEEVVRRDFGRYFGAKRHDPLPIPTYTLHMYRYGDGCPRFNCDQGGQKGACICEVGT